MNNITELQQTFPSISEIYKYSANNKLYKIKIKDVINAKINSSIVNWHNNRPADMTRCEEIKQYIINSYEQIEGMIYLYYNNDSHKFEIFDGLHRVTALCLIAGNNLILYDCRGVFANVYEKELLVNIRFNCQEIEIMKVFQNINSSVPVPSAYMNSRIDKVTTITTISNQFQIKYKSQFKTTRNPLIGNINVNNFTDLLDYLYDNKYNTIQLLETKLNELNEYIKNNPPPKLNDNAKTRCEDSGWYLPTYRVQHIIDYIIVMND